MRAKVPHPVARMGGGQGRALIASQRQTMARGGSVRPRCWAAPGDSPSLPYATCFMASLIFKEALLAASCKVFDDKWL